MALLSVGKPRMAKPILQYSQMVEDALRAVVRRALDEVAETGLPGNHHFYITFRTTHPNVGMAEYLKARYPAEMTIVLQYQFDDLEVSDTAFGVTLTFNNAPERLTIPFAAITVFADPSENFALSFQAPEGPEPASSPGTSEPSSITDGDGAKTGEIVSLDQFRRR
jgi:hypothetical protein